ncbi:MAG: lipopolysaccharide heptosyltransferase family protein [Chlamydiae bacterium]|nr:lipopolysaccharide heptosyltransferase family protein [Chlamydiota bacterium]
MLKRFFRFISPNPLDKLLRRALAKKQHTFLIVWNRGLGDIPLGLFAIVHRILSFIPDADITFITRKDLAEGFKLLPLVRCIIAKDWQRKKPTHLKNTLTDMGRSMQDWDIVIESPDPTYWVNWQLGSLVPRLKWNLEWDSLVDKFHLSNTKKLIGVHVQTETLYGYEKNWPEDRFKELFSVLVNQFNVDIILFGSHSDFKYSLPAIIDLRGRTSLLEMLSIIKNKCSYLLLPDSGVLSLTYFLDIPFPVRIVSLWADPNQGVLKQNVLSPNPLLQHISITAPGGDLKNVSVEEVIKALSLLDDPRAKYESTS